MRAGVLAFALGVGAAVANTPAVAFAAPDDTSSSGSSSEVVVDVQFLLRIRGKCFINGCDFIDDFVDLSGWHIRFDV